MRRYLHRENWGKITWISIAEVLYPYLTGNWKQTKILKLVFDNANGHFGDQCCSSVYAEKKLSEPV